jgi:hypothetical protein
VPLPDSVNPPPPGIVGVALACDAEVGAWRVVVDTDAWAGGALLVWTLDGTYVERHDGFRSVRAAEDGTSDQLRADVAIVGDFRPAANGRTAFSCAAEPSWLVAALAIDGASVGGCAVGGTDPTPLLALPGAPACPDLPSGPTDSAED